MVKSLTGKVGGADVAFRRNEAGLWETAVPASKNGSYVMELWAEDMAGNRTYFATVKVTFDTSQMCMRIEIADVGVGWSVGDVRTLFSVSPVSFARADTTVQSTVYFSSAVFSKIVRCEVCGR